MTLEEALEASGAEPVNDIFQINQENRTITVPESERIFGVSHDGNTERKHFRCPKIVGDNIDLSTMHLYINYQNANGQKYPYLVEDIRTDGDYITFSWLIGPDVVAYKGQIKFIVCAKKGDGTIPEWNTTLAEGTVLEGLEATDEVVDRNPDIIEQILTRLDNVTDQAQTSAEHAALSEQAAKEAETAAREARAGAEIAEDSAEQHASDALARKNEVEQKVAQFEATREVAVKAVNDAGTSQKQAVEDTGATQKQAVENAGTANVNTVNRAGEIVVQAVTDEGSKQMQGVTNEGAAQKKAIEDYAKEVLDFREQVLANTAALGGFSFVCNPDDGGLDIVYTVSE